MPPGNPCDSSTIAIFAAAAPMVIDSSASKLTPTLNGVAREQTVSSLAAIPFAALKNLPQYLLSSVAAPTFVVAAVTIASVSPRAMSMWSAIQFEPTADCAIVLDGENPRPNESCAIVAGVPPVMLRL